MNNKRIADSLTFLRVVVAALLGWLGLSQGSAGLSKAVFLLLLAWTSDALDGPLARRSSHREQSWIGKHDLEVDMIAACGLLSFMIFAGYVTAWVGLGYALAGLILFWLTRFPRSLGMLFQAPIYGWFIWTAYANGGWFGWLPIIWITTAVLITWPRFPQKVVPEFISGVQNLFKRA